MEAYSPNRCFYVDDCYFHEQYLQSPPSTIVFAHDSFSNIPISGLTDGKNYLHVHPMFLHSNATSHKWAFGGTCFFTYLFFL